MSKPEDSQHTSIPPLDLHAAESARARQATLTKPAGALGRLETLSVRLCSMTSNPAWLPRPAAALVFAADHGVAAQGVSAYPQSVTEQMVHNFLREGAAINVLARQMGTRLLVVDAGVIGDLPEHPHLVAGKIARGTQNFSQGRAMTQREAEQAVALGKRVANLAIDEGAHTLVIGEMGIGNTTSATAITAALSGERVNELAGRGTGVDDERLAHKIALIEYALALHAPASEGTLEKIGGLEIGAMAGAMLAGAQRRTPVIVDGVISSAAAMIAAQINPEVHNYLVASHVGAEPAHRVALAWLGLEPLLALDLRLGEGTGGLLALPIIEAAMRILQEMATFDEAGVAGRLD